MGHSVSVRADLFERIREHCNATGQSMGEFVGSLIEDMPPTTETQATIAKWANTTFGEPATNLSIAMRAQKEMSELIRKLEEDDWHQGAPEEAADVIIVLQRIFSRFDRSGTDEVDRKMRTNRARKWQLTGDGHGQHVKDGGK